MYFISFMLYLLRLFMSDDIGSGLFNYGRSGDAELHLRDIMLLHCIESLLRNTYYCSQKQSNLQSHSTVIGRKVLDLFFSMNMKDVFNESTPNKLTRFDSFKRSNSNSSKAGTQGWTRSL